MIVVETKMDDGAPFVIRGRFDNEFDMAAFLIGRLVEDAPLYFRVSINRVVVFVGWYKNLGDAGSIEGAVEIVSF